MTKTHIELGSLIMELLEWTWTESCPVESDLLDEIKSIENVGGDCANIAVCTASGKEFRIVVIPAD